VVKETAMLSPGPQVRPDDQAFLRLAVLGENDHEARCLPGRSGRIFGGQMLAQGLMAATAGRQEVNPERSYSLHAHFLNPGTPDEAVRFRTTTLRRSARFTTTRVDVTQASTMLATLTVSTHDDEPSPSHRPIPPIVLGSPDSAEAARGERFPAVDAPIRQPFDLRTACLEEVSGSDGRPRVAVWLRLRRPMTDPVAQVAALVWASDFALTRTADVEHEHRLGTRQAASLDHAMWIHRAVDLSRWHLYVLSSPMYRAGLALSCGQMYTDVGDLVASVAQESLLRRTVD
jgi:acyl-CoA thioesterase-2